MWDKKVTRASPRRHCAQTELAGDCPHRKPQLGSPVWIWRNPFATKELKKKLKGEVCMKTIEKSFSAILAIAALLTVLTQPAHATFPGKNGRIAFIQGPDVYSMNSDGSDIRQLTNLGPDSFAFWEFWSPDGKQLVFSVFNAPNFLGQLWLMNADGSNQHLLLAEDNFDEESPSFTPDGKSVVFTRCRTDVEACSLYQINLTGGTLSAVTPFRLGIQDFVPEFSADGAALAFVSFGRESLVAAIYRVNADGSGLERLTPPFLAAHTPNWSPDSKKIAFTSYCCNLQNEEIWTIKSDASDLSRSTKNGNEYFAGPHDFSPSWSPQGDAIVFERDSPDFSSFGIFVMKTDGSGLRQMLVVPRSAGGTALWRRKAMARAGNHSKKHPFEKIQESGGLPRWGVAQD